MMQVNFLGLEVEIPADPVGFIKTKAIELLNHLGYEWPVTDDAVLDAWGDRWGQIQASIEAAVADLENGVEHVLATNQGPTAAAFDTYMRSDDSNLASLKSTAAAASIAADSYHGAALIVRGLRTVVIGKLLLDAVGLAVAIVSGGASAGASLLLRAGIGGAISIAIDQAINQLMGGD